MPTLSKKTADDRRQGGDRRKRDRRRGGPQRAIVIEITRNMLRTGVLVKGVAGKPDAVDASSISWRESAPHLRSRDAVKELAAALRKAIAQHSLQGESVHIVLSGEYCVTRVLRGPTEAVRAELKDIEQRSRLYLALGPGEKAAVTRSKSISARLSYALAVACHQDTLQNVRDAAEIAGLHVECIEPELTALSRAAARLSDLPAEPYLLALVDDENLELGLCLNGELLTDYRPGGRIAADDLPRIVDQHLARLQRYATRFVAGDEPTIRRIYIAGDAGAVEKSRRQFAARSTMEVRTIDAQHVQATWEMAPGALAAATPTTLGGLLAAYYPPAQRDCPNLMEHLLAKTREPVRPIVLRSLAPIAAVLLAAAGLTALLWNEHANVAALEAKLEPLASVQGRATELRLQKLRSAAKLAELTTLASQVPGRSGRQALELIANSMPDDVWLRRFVMTDLSSISLEGASYLEAGVYDFVRWLEQAPGCREVALQGANPGTSEAGPVTYFTLEVGLASPDRQEPRQEIASRE